MIKFQLEDADVFYKTDFYTSEKAWEYFEILLKETDWQEDEITVFGKTYPQPRLTALFGDSDKSYSYSNIKMFPKPFTKLLQTIKEDIEKFSGEKFNTVLLNLYRDGSDSNGWHSDDEKELGKNPAIASVSFGAERVFHLQNKKDKSIKQKLILENGSLLVMKGETQHTWQHQIPKTKKLIGARINLTFRKLM